jgi:hypothetical protein
MNKKSLLKTIVLTGIFAVGLQANAQVFTDSLILDLPMNGDATDHSGNGNNGTVFNVVADTNRLGTPNSAFRFNGTDSYIEIPASPSMNKIQTANEISITAWINIRQWFNNWNVFAILERYNPNTDAGWGLEANWAAGGMLFLADETNVQNRADCSFTWNFNQWYHIGFTYSQTDSMAKFYVDGANVCSVPYTANINIADTTASFAIGRSLAGPDEYSDGLIDDFKVFYRVLSSTEIDTAFTTGIKDKHLENEFAFYPNPAKETITVGNFPFGSNVTITDITGKQIYSSVAKTESLTIGTSNFANGIYFIQVESKGAVSNRKIMVSR